MRTLEYQSYTKLIKENRKKIQLLKNDTPSDPKLKINRFTQINELLKEQNALIMERQQLLLNRAKLIQNYYSADQILRVG
ncbi:MAG: hypothetical protein AB8H03_18625 [Saprospiraceae bacterium]